jgi:hypothetical protein
MRRCVWRLFVDVGGAKPLVIETDARRDFQHGETVGLAVDPRGLMAAWLCLPEIIVRRMMHKQQCRQVRLFAECCVEPGEPLRAHAAPALARHQGIEADDA